MIHSTLSRRDLLISLAGLVPILAACGRSRGEASGNAAESGQIVLQAYSGVFRDNYTKAVIEPFMKKYPNIKVTYQDQENSAKGLASLRAQKNNPQVDIVIMDISIANTGNKEGIFDTLDTSVVTNLADLYDQAKVPGNFGPAVTFDNLVLIYNTDLVKPAPTSWEELWNPAYSGKVIVTAPPDIQGLALTVIVDKMQGADYKQTIEPAIAKLKELAPRVQTWNPQPDQYTIVASGNAALAIGWNARAQLYADKSGGKLGVVLPKEGSIFQINTINLVKGSRNRKAAEVFINYALSPEAQKAFTETMFYAPVNSKTQVAEAVLNRTASSPDKMKQMIPVDWSYIGQVRDQWLDVWRKQVIGG